MLVQTKDDLTCTRRISKEFLAVCKAKDPGAGLVAVKDGPINRRNVQSREITLKDATVALFERHLILEFECDNLGLLPDSPSQNQNPADDREGQRPKP